MTDVDRRSDTSRFLNVTEFAGQQVSQEQLYRTCHRYYWAAQFCADKDVIELACGGGAGLGFLSKSARSVQGSDISPEVLARAKQVYGDSITLSVSPAAPLPLNDNSIDVVLLFEALYYLPDAEAFVSEVRRVLRPDGKVLIVTANKDLFDFTPSPASTCYYGTLELERLLDDGGFDARCWGYVDVSRLSLRQRVFRPAKFLASKLGLIPRTMDGKSFLKRLVFGELVTMPGRIDEIPFNYEEPVPLPSFEPCRGYKVIYCAGSLRK